MVWGVRDGDHEIVGTTVDLAAATVGAEPFMLWLNKYLTPHINVHHVAFDVSGKHVEMLCIEPGYIQPVAFQGKETVRVDSALQSLKNYPERARSLWQITSSYSFEKSVIIAHATPDEIFNNFAIKKLLALFGHEGKSQALMLDNLESRGLIESNMQGGYTVFALLGLGAAENLNDFPLSKFKGLRVTVYKGTDKLESSDDTEGQRGYITSFKAMLSFIMGKIPSAEQMLHGVRTKVYAIPELAIREFLANTLVHQDLTSRGSRPLVEIYKDRVRFINPGRPLVDPDRFIDTPSRSRNEQLATLMHQAGLCELRGSGVDRAIREIERAILPPPLFSQVEGSTIVTVFMPKKFADMTSAERIRACFQHAQLLHERNEELSNASLRSRFGLPTTQISQVSNVIRDAINEGRIKPLDPDQGNRNARYIPSYA